MRGTHSRDAVSSASMGKKRAWPSCARLHSLRSHASGAGVRSTGRRRDIALDASCSGRRASSTARVPSSRVSQTSVVSYSAPFIRRRRLHRHLSPPSSSAQRASLSHHCTKRSEHADAGGSRVRDTGRNRSAREAMELEDGKPAKAAEATDMDTGAKEGTSLVQHSHPVACVQSVGGRLDASGNSSARSLSLRRVACVHARTSRAPAELCATPRCPGSKAGFGKVEGEPGPPR